MLSLWQKKDANIRRIHPPEWGTVDEPITASGGRIRAMGSYWNARIQQKTGQAAELPVPEIPKATAVLIVGLDKDQMVLIVKPVK